ncbi:Palmitoyltransferase, partial [Kickxella alabastrina]
AHFLRFVYTVDVTCVFALALHGLRLWELVIDSLNGTYYVRQPTQAEVAFLIINMTLAGLVLLFVGILSGYHAYLVGSNTTTIESREKSRVEKLVRQRKCQPTPYPYNLGVVRNFRSVFGPNILTWWVPRNMSDDGLNFSIGPGLTAPVYWPPLGYTRENAVAEVAPRTVFHGKDGTRVVSEMDADGEMVLRNYNASADLATLENGGTAPLKMDSGGDDDKSEAGDIDYDLDESTDSDDDICDAQPSYARTSAVAHTTSTVQRRTVFSATTNARGSDYVRRYAGYASESDSDNQPLIRKQQ